MPKGSTITPYNKLHGRFIHANTKTPFALVAADQPASGESPAASGESPDKTVQTPSKNGTGEVGFGGDDAKDDITNSLLHPEMDNNIQQMEVDLLGNHHPSESMMQDTGSMPSMFGDGNSIGDLLSNMSNGSLGQTNENLSFSNLSLTLSGNQNSLSLAPPTNNILMHSDSMETNDAVSLIGGSGDGSRTENGVEQDSLTIKEVVKMEVVEEEEEKEIDELLKEGLTAASASGITATDIYLMVCIPVQLR